MSDIVEVKDHKQFLTLQILLVREEIMKSTKHHTRYIVGLEEHIDELYSEIEDGDKKAEV